MFPDAITERGRKHLLHLKELQNEGYHTGVLFLVQWGPSASGSCQIIIRDLNLLKPLKRWHLH